MTSKNDTIFALATPAGKSALATIRISGPKAFDAIKKRLEDNDVLVAAEVDHDWCKSIYLIDPNDIMVEFSITYNEEKWAQTPEQAYDMLFNTDLEKLSEGSEKVVSDPG